MNDLTGNESEIELSLIAEESRKKKQGFACISPERLREIASKGGKTAHALGNAHKFTSEEARVAGKKGGNAYHVRRGKQAAKP